MIKKTIVLLPGWLHNFENETKFVNELKRHFNIVIFKYPGYYGEKGLNDLPRKYDLSDLVYSKIKDLNLKNYYLLSFSMGCQVALHTVKKYNLEKKIILISPTMQTLEDKVPLLLRPLLKNRYFFKLIRSSKYISGLMVDMAYKSISHITENGKITKNKFNNLNITTTGAFDTLYFLVTNFINPTEYQKQSYFIFGDKEILQKDMKASDYSLIKNCGHGNFNEKYKEFAEVVKRLMSNS